MAEDAIASRRVQKAAAAARGGRSPSAAPQKASAGRRRGGRGGLARRLGHGRLARCAAALLPVCRRFAGSLARSHRKHSVRLALPPVETVADIAAMLATITAALRRGIVTPAEAAALSEIADSYARAFETRDFDRRLRALEAAHAAQH